MVQTSQNTGPFEYRTSTAFRTPLYLNIISLQMITTMNYIKII